jgi:hypothetical protein
VRGDTLYFVEFLHRRQDGRGVDRVGKAVQATLRFSEEHQPFVFPFEDPTPAVRRDTLRAHICQMQMHSEEYDLYVEDRVSDLPLPARLTESGFRSYAETEVRLSRDQRDALCKEFPFRPEQKLLFAAFGEACLDLLQADFVRSESGQTVLAWDGAVEIDSGHRCKFTTLAAARYDRAGEVLLRFRGKDVTAETMEVSALLAGDDSSSLTLEGPDGRQLLLPGTKTPR